MFVVKGLEFKNYDLAEEWDKSGWIDPKLRAITCYLAFYCYKEFNKTWIITQISRSEQQQIQLYPEYFQKFNRIKPSKHLSTPVKAIDARSHHLKPEEIEKLKSAFYENFTKGFGDTTAYFTWHKGTAYHIHYQV